MTRKARMIIFAVIGVLMTIGLFVFTPKPEKKTSLGSESVPAVVVSDVARPTEPEEHADAASGHGSAASNNPGGLVEAVSLDGASATNSSISESSPEVLGGYLARIQLDAPDQVEAALRRAQLLYESGEIRPGDKPLTFVLHGPEVSIFFKENYAANQRLVDLAAKLSAFKVVDMKICATRLGTFGEERPALAPFVSTVPFGPAEINRLLDEESFIYF